MATPKEFAAMLPNNSGWEKPGLAPSMVRAAQQNRIYIYNVGPRTFLQAQGSLGTFTIPACEPGEAVSRPLILEGVYYETVVVDTKKLSHVPTEGMDLAKDIIGTGPFKSRDSDLRRFGVFIASGEKPTKLEITVATEAWHATCSALVQEADGLFSVNGGMDAKSGQSNIGDHHREAAAVLGVERPWARKNLKMVPCAACQRPVLPGVVRCPHEGCGAVLDEEKARKFYPHLYGKVA